MIQTGTWLNVIDNSGAKEVGIIQVLKGYRKRYAAVGDMCICSVKSLRTNRREKSKIQKGDVLKALVVRTKVPIKTYSGDSQGFFENAAILLSRQNKLLGTRVFGAVPKMLRYTKFLRVVSLASGFIR